MRPTEREAWRQADEVFSGLLELAPGQRRNRLAELELPAEVRQRVERLLEAADREVGPLDSPLVLPPLVLRAGAEAGGAERGDAPSLSGRRLGAYELDEEIGRGGMAVVYRAHRVDGAFDQEVAVKVLGIGLLPTGAGLRFRREQQLLARLRHPNIATMLDGGVAGDGTPYLVMERIDGQPLDRWCAERELSLRERVALLAQVCAAVAFAHRNLIVHRDLKPSNILVDRAGNVKLLDFGIAKLLEPEDGGPEATEIQGRFMTPGYAAPEQVAGGPISTATDVFGLGKVLERLLHPPTAATPVAADADLVNITQRALRTEPERRYADARALGADLESWLAGRPVVATPDSLLYRFRKLLARRRAAAVVTLLIAGIAASGVMATLRQSVRARREARTAATVNAFLVDLFRASDPQVAEGENPRASELLRRGAARAREQLAGEPVVEAELLHTIGRIQREVGAVAAAHGTLEEALRLRALHLPPASVDTAQSRFELGKVRYEEGRTKEAQELMGAAVDALRRALPADDPALLAREAEIADLQVRRGDAPR